MKLLILVALSAALLGAAQGGISEGRNVKTSVKQLSWLEKTLIRKFHPKMDLPKMSALDAKKDDQNTLEDDYVGALEALHVEFPLLLLQLVKMGDDILLPTFHYEYDMSYCIEDSCYGFFELFQIRNARLKTVTTTNLHASMNGTKFRVEFTIPEMEIECPECTLDDTDYHADSTSDNYFWRGYSVFVKNYSMILTGDFGWNFDSIDVVNLDLTWEIEEFWDRLWNATHTAADGTQEELGPLDNFIHEWLMGNWALSEEETEEDVAYWLNCYLSNGRNDKEGKCDHFFLEPLHNITPAEVLHSFGLAALNNHGAAESDLPGQISLNAADPIETVNRILFQVVPHVMQTGKFAAALLETPSLPIPVAFTWVLNREICSDHSTGRTACEMFQEQTTIGAPSADSEYTTNVYGAQENRASLTFDANTVSYSFQVPNLTLSSSDYQRILTNLKTGDQQVFSGLKLNVFNCTVGFVADYAFDEAAGQYAIFMNKIELMLDKVTMDITDVKVSENGEWVDLPSIHKDAAPMVRELWEGKDQDGVSLEERYRAFLEEKINDFLAGKIAI